MIKPSNPLAWEAAAKLRGYTWKLTWTNGRTGRKAFQTGHIGNILLTMWNYQQAGIEMLDKTLTARRGRVERHVIPPTAISKSGPMSYRGEGGR